MVDLNIFNPTKVRALVEAKDQRIAELEQEVRRLREALKDADRESREAIRDAAAEANWKSTQGDDYGSY